jgi:defect in organelle trafficking protein DotC
MRGKILLLSTVIGAGLLLAAPVAAQQYQQQSQGTGSMIPADAQVNINANSAGMGATGGITAAQQNMLLNNTQNANATSQAVEQEREVIQVYHGDKTKRFSGYENPEPPPTLEELQNLEKDETTFGSQATPNSDEGIAYSLRKEAMQEAGVSLGARGGLAWRTYEIRMELATRERQLDKVYDFRQLLIPAPSGLLIEPPIVSESLNALLIKTDGQSAAVSDRLYNIVRNAKIVSTSRTWRSYLEREWGTFELPPDILRPESEEERRDWVKNVEKGWHEGISQADEIFQDDLNVLMADFQGMVRYRALLAQGMISPPYALQVDRGVTGGGEEMRIGDRAVQITGVPELITGSDQWQPANR